MANLRPGYVAGQGDARPVARRGVLRAGAVVACGRIPDVGGIEEGRIGMEDGIDTLRAVVVGGSGVVARFPGVVCVAGPGGTAAVRALLDLCATASGAAPGRPLGHSLARWLAGPDAPPDDLVFGTVATADEHVAVFLRGPVTARLTDAGAATTLSGVDAVAWTDRLVRQPGDQVLLALDAAEVPAGVGGQVHDLRSGVVPGAGVALLPEGADLAAAASGGAPGAGSGSAPGPLDTGLGLEPVPAADSTPAPAAEVAVPPTPRAPRLHARIDDHVEHEDTVRPPLEDGIPAGGPTVPRSHRPGASPAAAEVVTERSREPVARGFVCSRGHLNDPRSHFCVLCGIRMNERTGVLTTGPRPPLGLLVFDDGRTYSVDAEYVVGRTPEADERVRTGELRALMVEDRGDTISRVHAEVRIRDWDVLLVDAGSRNGTFVVPPAAVAWERVPERRTLRLEPGTRVRLGHHRTFVFESPSGVR
jgi:FHA domain